LPGNKLGQRGRFQPGSAGKRPGSIRRITRDHRDWCEAQFRGHAPAVITQILGTPARTIRERELQLDCIRWLSDRCFGKAPAFLGVVTRRGIEPGSPEYELLKLAGQRVPGENDWED
jgi:hypothetical protein